MSPNSDSASPDPGSLPRYGGLRADGPGAAGPRDRLRILLLSFGYKHGVPREADLLMDVRFLPNPYYIPDLSPLDGRDPRVREFLRSTEELKYFFEKFGDLLDYLLPLYEMEPRSCLTLAVGCTGGRHRSVMVTEELRSRFEAMGKEVALCHRDIHLP